MFVLQPNGAGEPLEVEITAERGDADTAALIAVVLRTPDDRESEYYIENPVHVAEFFQDMDAARNDYHRLNR